MSEDHHQLAEVNLAVQVETSFGDCVRVVGSAGELGSWNPCRGAELRTEPGLYPRWSGSIRVPVSACAKGVEYKFVIVRANGDICWENGSNRRLDLHPDDRSFEEGPEGMRRRGTRVLDELLESGANAEAPRFGETLPEPPKARRVPFLTLPSGHGASPVCGTGAPLKTLAGVDAELPRPESLTTIDMSDSQISESPSAASLPDVQQALAMPTASASEKTKMRLWPAASRLQKPGGPCEDAYFFSSQAMGIADGVSHMADFAHYGVDAAAYAAELMELAAAALLSGPPPGAAAGGHAAAADRAVAAMAEADAKATTFGATTVSLLALDGCNVGVANLGDSGFVLLRRKSLGMEIVEQSREQCHSWNCPYQFTRVPLALQRYLTQRLDTAEDSDKYQVQVCHGDLLLLYTDGLSDNLHWHEVTSILNDVIQRTPAEGAKAWADPKDLADALVNAAYDRSLDEKAFTPFAKHAKQHQLDYPGGKPDDISVVAAWVLEDACLDGACTLTIGEAASPSQCRTTEYRLCCDSLTGA